MHNSVCFHTVRILHIAFSTAGNTEAWALVAALPLLGVFPAHFLWTPCDDAARNNAGEGEMALMWAGPVHDRSMCCIPPRWCGLHPFQRYQSKTSFIKRYWVGKPRDGVGSRLNFPVAERNFLAFPFPLQPTDLHRMLLLGERGGGLRNAWWGSAGGKGSGWKLPSSMDPTS